MTNVELRQMVAGFKAHPTINTHQATGIDLNTLRVKYSVDGGDVKVADYDFRHCARDVTYKATDEIILELFYFEPEAWIAILANDIDINRKGSRQAPFPHNFLKNEPDITEAPEATFFAPPPETDVQYHERLAPFLHDAAKSYLDQHIPTAEITGNPRGTHATTRHAASKSRADTTANAFRLPIGFAARELDCHKQGKDSGLTREALETLIKEIHEVFTKDDAWWEHHYGHDVRYWNKYHTARQVLFQNPDGEIQPIYDIDANIRKNLPKIDRENTDLIARHGEVEFESLARDWFNHALYGPREHVTERVLTFVEK